MSDGQTGAKLVGRIDQRYERYETWFSPTVRSSVLIPIDVIEAIVARERAAAQALADALKIIVDGDGEHSDPCGGCETCQMVGRDALKEWEERT